MIAKSLRTKSPCVVLIPSYDPDMRLVEIVDSLADSDEFERIIVVNDGSHQDCSELFERVQQLGKVTLLEHAVNLGKGAALKTGLNHVLCRYGEAVGIVTVDADGQHLPDDVGKVAAELQLHPRSLIIGVRNFQGKVPLRSRFGNALTNRVFRVLVGCNLVDTQSGLRGIPFQLAKDLLRLKTGGYEFELDMLIQARAKNIPVRQCSIATVYEEGNKSSHFNPLWDSLKIYLVFLRFMLASVVTSVLGLTAFQITHLLTANLLVSEVILCIVGLVVNFLLCRKMVFHSRQSVLLTFVRFLGLVFGMGAVSYFMTWGLSEWLPIGVLPARVAAALVLYLANFSIQRDFIFKVNEASDDLSGSEAVPVDDPAVAATIQFCRTESDAPIQSKPRAA